MKINGVLVGVAWALAIVLGYYGPGDFIATATPAFEGVDRGLQPRGPLYVFALAVLAAVLATLAWVRDEKEDGEGGACAGEIREALRSLGYARQ